jgi:hypothetical protein
VKENEVGKPDGAEAYVAIVLGLIENGEATKDIAEHPTFRVFCGAK